MPKKAAPPAPYKPTKKELDSAAALRASAGIKAAAAERLGIDRSTMQERVEKSPYLQRVLAEVKETMLDLAEGNVAVAIRAKDDKMTRWYLQQQGKERGFGPNLRLDLGEDAAETIAQAFAKADAAGLRAARRRLDK